MPSVRITVVKRLNFDEIHADSDVGCTPNMDPVCPRFEEGQEFMCEPGKIPEGFCRGAFVDIFRAIAELQHGVNYPWVKEPGQTLVCCTDGFRPVVFRLDRMED